MKRIIFAGAFLLVAIASMALGQNRSTAYVLEGNYLKETIITVDTQETGYSGIVGGDTLSTSVTVLVSTENRYLARVPDSLAWQINRSTLEDLAVGKEVKGFSYPIFYNPYLSVAGIMNENKSLRLEGRALRIVGKEWEFSRLGIVAILLLGLLAFFFSKLAAQLVGVPMLPVILVAQALIFNLGVYCMFAIITIAVGGHEELNWRHFILPNAILLFMMLIAIVSKLPKPKA